ncbi:MAG: hypothetical protein HYW25_05690 [Candidatus Aenigmarchaeota archaeon]|nr:hypothetical protein [Candidatus Aenigmarchaeota archaeon]
MHSDGRWRSAHLAEAREKCKELLALVEALHQRHRSLHKGEIKSHGSQLEEETEEAMSSAREIFKEILRELEAHRKHVRSTEKFLKRHYRIGSTKQQ